MDLKVLMEGSDGQWTEERHYLFLNWMEATFVRQVLGVSFAGGDGAVPCRCMVMDGGLRLDSHIPDSTTESTEDSRRRLPASPSLETETVSDSESRCSSNTTRKRPLALCDASLDQVVPEFENREDGEVTSGSVKRKR